MHTGQAGVPYQSEIPYIWLKKVLCGNNAQNVANMPTVGQLCPKCGNYADSVAIIPKIFLKIPLPKSTLVKMPQC